MYTDTTRIEDTDHYELGDLLNAANVPNNDVRNEVQAFLARIYPLDGDSEDFDEDAATGKPSYVISTREDYDYAENITEIHRFHVNLPNDEAATELAGILDGTIEEGLAGERPFTVTLTVDIQLNAKTEEEARDKFAELRLEKDIPGKVTIISVKEAGNDA